ncbi:MAG: hypothetical protein K2L02_05660 [Clostridia bacterium]|nr:hypothetical protein [Clostridia bacterium]
MDARITKQRLANMLTYDWLKILGTIALAAVVFCVFFMMIATRATVGQTYYIYVYSGLTVGGDFNGLKDDLKNKSVFSYDILDLGSESFNNSGVYGSTAFSARRSAGEGRVMFVSDDRTTDENGKEFSTLLSFIDNEGTSAESFALFLDPQVFLNDCEKYLQKFFGENLSGELNREQARSTFMERNGKDKRFRSAAKKEAGVKQEEARLEKLKKDFLTVREAVDTESLGFVKYTGFGEKEHVIGFSMESLHLTKLVYYTEKDEDREVVTNSKIALCIFNNKEREGDLKYETVNFLAYLLEKYGAVE